MDTKEFIGDSMTSIPTLIGLLLTSCTEEDNQEKTEDPQLPDPIAFSIYECIDNMDCDINIIPVTITEQELISLLDDQGQLSEETCVQICNDADISEVCECEFVGPNELNTQTFICSTSSCDFPYEGRGNGEISKISHRIGPNKAAEWSSRAFHAEASSVAAFLQIRKELQSFGAPKQLQQRCLLAACEEIQHARSMYKITAQLNGKLSSLHFGTTPNRSLLDFAIDNVQEGCVNEAYAALCAVYQSQKLPPSKLKQLLYRIAEDELGHVTLSYDIHHWCMKQLSESERQLVLNAQKQAFARLMNTKPQNNSYGLPLPNKNTIKKLQHILCVIAA